MDGNTKLLILAVEDFINEPARKYDIEPMEVRDYRHELYRKWGPLCRYLMARPLAQPGDDEVERVTGAIYGVMYGTGMTAHEHPEGWGFAEEIARAALAAIPSRGEEVK